MHCDQVRQSDPCEKKLFTTVSMETDRRQCKCVMLCAYDVVCIICVFKEKDKKKCLILFYFIHFVSSQPPINEHTKHKDMRVCCLFVCYLHLCDINIIELCQLA